MAVRVKVHDRLYPNLTSLRVLVNLLLGLVQTLITFQGNPNTWWTRIAVGFLLLLFILLQKAIGGRRLQRT